MRFRGLSGQGEKTTLVGEANDANGGALRRARFVRLKEAGKCRGRAGRQVRRLMRTRRAEWERRSYVAEVFDPTCLGILARHWVYVRTIQFEF
jgi:hypothetical protein